MPVNPKIAIIFVILENVLYRSEKFQKVKKSERFYAKSVVEDNIDQQFYWISEAILLDPENVDFYLFRMQLNNKIKSFDKVIEDGYAILEISKENADAYKNLGIYYLRMRDTDKARANFEKAKQFDSSLDLSEYDEELKLLA